MLRLSGHVAFVVACCSDVVQGQRREVQHAARLTVDLQEKKNIKNTFIVNILILLILHMTEIINLSDN